MKYKLHEADKAVLARPEIQRMLATDFSEALRQGPSGMLDDMSANHGRPWGFPLEEIETKVRLWYCEHDRSVPPAMGRYLSETIPNCDAKFIPGAGHLWILEHLDEVLTTLRSGVESSEDES